jgi:glycosyltransferase involved in cell wall biosynthesis
MWKYGGMNDSMSDTSFTPQNNAPKNGPKRALVFSLVYYPRFIGGAEVAVKEITDRISSDEIEFDMITLRKHAPAFNRVGNVNVYRVGFSWLGGSTKSSKIFPLSKLLFPFLVFFKALKLHRKQKYDFTWPIMASYAGFAALLFKKINKDVPIVLTIQEGDNFERRDGIFSPMFRAIFKSADHIQAISNFLAEWAKKKGAKCPVDVVPNGVDVELFTRGISIAEESDLKSKLDKKDGDVFLITTSRLVMKNGVANIVDSLTHLPDNVKLFVLGTGILENDLKAQVAYRKLEERVKFLGFIAHKDMPQYLHVSDIFVRPSLSEGLGNSFLEAMAAGIPVIATPVGGIPDFLTDGETGLFCEVNNPQSIAQKVEKLIKDKESREYIVKNAKKMVEERYSWERVAGEMKRIFNK